MRNGILVGIALVAIALGFGAVLTASHDYPPNADIRTLTEGRASAN